MRNRTRKGNIIIYTDTGYCILPKSNVNLFLDIAKQFLCPSSEVASKLLAILLIER